MKYSKLALLLAMSAVLPCRADDAKTADVPIPNQVVQPTKETRPYISLGIDDVAIPDLLKVIAKTFNFSISVDENIRGALYGEEVYGEEHGKGLVENFDWIAKRASLSITISDDGTIVAKQLPKGQSHLPLEQPASNSSGFRLKLILNKPQFLPGDRIESKIQLERDAGQPAANVMWGSLLKPDMQLTLISLEDHALVTKNRPINPMSDLDLFDYLTSKPTLVTADSPLHMPYSLTRRLRYPLKPGRYFYFATYRSQPKGATLDGQAVWEGELNSNVVEFEVLPAPKVGVPPVGKG